MSLCVCVLSRHTSTQIQDPLVLLDPVCLRDALLEWLPVLERVLGPEEQGSAAVGESNMDRPEEESWDRGYLNSEHEASSCSLKEPTENATEEEEVKEESQEVGVLSESLPEPVRVVSPKAVQSDLLINLTQLATLYAELSCFRKPGDEHALECTTFLRRYSFLLDKERVRRMCLLCHREQPEVQSSFIEAMLGQNLLLPLSTVASPCHLSLSHPFYRKMFYFAASEWDLHSRLKVTLLQFAKRKDILLMTPCFVDSHTR